MSGRFKTAFKDTFRTLRVLALEVLGGFFLALAAFGAASVVQEYQRYALAPEGGVWRVALAAVFSIAMAAFGIHSFWRSRRIQK